MKKYLVSYTTSEHNLSGCSFYRQKSIGVIEFKRLTEKAVRNYVASLGYIPCERDETVNEMLEEARQWGSFSVDLGHEPNDWMTHHSLHFMEL